MEIAGRDIVTNGVPKDVLQCVLFADVVSILPDDDAQLALVVKQFLRVWVDLDVVQWSCEAIRRGCKDDWLLWWRELPRTLVRRLKIRMAYSPLFLLRGTCS